MCDSETLPNSLYKSMRIILTIYTHDGSNNKTCDFIQVVDDFS